MAPAITSMTLVDGWNAGKQAKLAKAVDEVCSGFVVRTLCPPCQASGM